MVAQSLCYAERGSGAGLVNTTKGPGSGLHFAVIYFCPLGQSLTTSKDNDIHYSTVSSLSLDDAEKLKLKMVQVIQDYVETINLIRK